ncbi:MAG: DUF4157 domain-containing protein [Acidobacteria bacterium]|nr:DUF4157 domain-containing protein [Acidobacteriota bacterium]
MNINRSTVGGSWFSRLGPAQAHPPQTPAAPVKTKQVAHGQVLQHLRRAQAPSVHRAHLPAGQMTPAAHKAAPPAVAHHAPPPVQHKRKKQGFFGKLFGGIKKAVGAVGHAVSSVGHAVGRAATGVVKTVSHVVQKAGHAVGNVVKGASNLLGGLFKKVGHAVGQVAKTVGNVATKVVHSVGNVVKSVASKVGQGLKAVGSAVRKGVQWAGRAVSDAAKWIAPRIGDAARGLFTGVVEGAAGVFKNIFEGAGTFASGIGEIFKGHFLDGLKDMGLGLAKTFVQTPLDALLLVGGRAVSAIQTLTGIEPPGRKLNDSEIAELRKIYGDSIDYSKIRIKEGKAGLFSTNDRPFTHGNTIYMKDNKITPELLAHEVGHVWQYQNGGSDYMSEAIIGQSWGEGYDWEKGVKEGKSWKDLNPEQQAELMENAYSSGFFNGAGKKFMYNGTDYTSYLNDALKQVRAGQGAP